MKMLKNSMRMRIGKNTCGEQIFKALITHPMETGYRRDKKTGQLIPADYIEDVLISVDGETYFEMMLGEYVSRNPFLSFTLSKPLVDNQIMQISWIDNNKREVSYDFVVRFKQEDSFGFSGAKKGSEIVQVTPEAPVVCKNNIHTTKH